MNQRKIIYTVIGIAAALFCLYHAVYFESLTDRKAESARGNFSPEQLVDHFWDNQLEGVLAMAIDLETFDRLLTTDPQELTGKYGKTLGIGAPWSIVVRGETVIEDVDPERCLLQPVGTTRYALPTDHIFSNTVREASGCFSIDDFENTMDFNLLSAELNRRVIADVVAPVAVGLKPGATVAFVGAADVQPGKRTDKIVDIIPLQLTVQP